jgi:hypothetical protein
VVESKSFILYLYSEVLIKILLISNIIEKSNIITKNEEIGNNISHKTRNLSNTMIESINEYNRYAGKEVNYEFD